MALEDMLEIIHKTPTKGKHTFKEFLVIGRKNLESPKELWERCQIEFGLYAENLMAALPDGFKPETLVLGFKDALYSHMYEVGDSGAYEASFAQLPDREQPFTCHRMRFEHYFANDGKTVYVNLAMSYGKTPKCHH